MKLPILAMETPTTENVWHVLWEDWPVYIVYNCIYDTLAA